VKLHHRLVVPFALIALVATSATAYVALRVTARALRERVEAQILNTAALVGQSDFALNPAILSSVKAIAGAEVLTFSADGRVLASTLDPESAARRAALADTAARNEALASNGTVSVLHHADCGEPCDIAYRRLAARPDAIVAVVASRAGLMAATRAVTRTIVVAAVVSVLVMALVSQAVARRVTAPLDELGRFAGDVSAGNYARRARASDDEVGRLGAAFNEMLARLEHSQAALLRSEKLGVAGLVAARVAHDIRNPLSSMKMQTQLLRAGLRQRENVGRRDTDAQSAEMLDAVLRDIGQVETVIAGLLELARPGELRRQPTRLDSLVREVLEQLGPQLAHRKIEVVTEMDAALPAVPLDPDRFRQALLNVVNNAADAMTSGGVLTVAVRRDGAAVALEVCDDGTGIAPELAGRVFDPFVSSKRDGVGLGLVNARAVVESHGGRIELAARAPRGTRATLTVPLADQTHG
jgi:signal transduction histidine kinase